ncbi:MAG: ABC transporter permease [Ruminococcus sp.]|nr:ABC transporter permease [Ruminococcus sp.]
MAKEEKKQKSRSSENIGQRIFKCGVISWAIILVVWGLGSLAYDDYFLPSPKETIDSLIILVQDGTLWADFVASISRVAKGWALAVVFGVPLGLLVGSFKPVRYLVEPILSFFRFVPAIALTTLFLMWFGVGEESKVALIFYASFFAIFVNTIAGVVSTDQSLVEAASCMGAKKARVFFTVILPSAVANIFTGIRLGLSSSILTVIAAEMLVGSDGLGYLIQSSKLYYRTSWAFAGIVTLALLGFIADRLLQFIGRKKLGHYGLK